MFTTIEIIGMVAFAAVLVTLAIGFQIFDHFATRARVAAKEEAEKSKHSK